MSINGVNCAVGVGNRDVFGDEASATAAAKINDPTHQESIIKTFTKIKTAAC